MVTISKGMCDEIRNIANLYVEKERARIKRANAEIVERLRVTDPFRYDAIQKGQFVVKTYYGDMGCIENEKFETSTQALEYIRRTMSDNGPDDNFDYLYYGPKGEHIPLDLSWIPQVRCK